MNHLRQMGIVVVGLTLALASGAQDAPPPDAGAADSASTMAETKDRVTIHGYLSQAYAKSEDHQFIGIPTHGSFDYRRAALLFRADVSDNDSFVVQLAQRRLGNSPAMRLEPDVKLDWAFYEHRFEGGTSVRVGRLPSPLGIYSETRYVGTLLPLYRAPFNFYQEGSFTSENINGVKVMQTIAPASPWNAEIHVFGGGLRMTQVYAGLVNSAFSENVVGAQVWINTGLEGLRFGWGGQTFYLRNTILSADLEDRWETWVASAELSRSRFRVSGEYSEIRFDSENNIKFRLPAYYVYGGLHLTDKLEAHVQFDSGDSTFEAGPLRFEFPDVYRDWTGGLSYRVRPDLVLKAEHHWVKGRLREDNPVPLQPQFSPSDDRYFILSLSASF